MGTNAQQFCLKWNNHQANMLTVFDRLLSSRSLVDVTIGCEGRQVKAHKVVLSACSPFFENLFTENPCKHPIVILKDIRYADLKALVEFMYKGEVNVVQEQLPTLLKTAEALKIKGLAEVTGEGGKSDDNKPNATVTQRPDSPGTSSRRKRQRVRRKSTDSVVAHSDSEESVPKASRTEHDDSSMDGATSLDDGSQASLQQSNQLQSKEASTVQNNAVTVNNSSLSSVVAAGNNATTANTTTTNSNGPNSSAKDTDFEPTRLLEASMTTDHGADNNSTDLNSTGPENTLIPDGLDIKPIITLEEGGATPTGAIVPASGASSLSTGTDAISSLFPQGTGATALPGTSYQASPQSHALVRPASVTTPTAVVPASFLVAKPSVSAIVPATATPTTSYYQVSQPDSPQSGGSSGGPVKASACPCCHKSFFDRSTMKRHMKRHFADRETYDCLACTKSFTRKDKLRDHLKSARHILTVYGTNSIPASERPPERTNSPSSASSPEHPGPSSEVIAALPVHEAEVVRFMEKLRTMGRIDGLQAQLNTVNMIGNIISDYDAEAEPEAENGDERVPVESPPLSQSSANESS